VIRPRNLLVPILSFGVAAVVYFLLQTEYRDKLGGLASQWVGAESVRETSAVNKKPNSPKKKSGGGKAKPYSGELPSLAAVNIRNAVLETLTDELEYPWAMEFLPGEKLLITEFRGAMKILSLADGKIVEVSGLPEIPAGPGQVGLMDIALHPDFVATGLIYFSHAVTAEGGEEGFAMAVSRASLRGNHLQNVTRIFVATPYGKSASNFGGALAFDRDGLLYIATGDRSERDHSQDRQSLRGKILRLTDAGAVPLDNPFVGHEDTADQIFALGVRNPQGLVFDEFSGDLYQTEHGPMGGDEVNYVTSGKNYGWPRITHGANYMTQKIGVGNAEAGLEQPLYYYLPSMAISPLEIYHGPMFPEWEGNLLVGMLKGSQISKLDLLDGAVISEQRILAEIGDRVRDLKVADDGSLYILVQKGRLYRLFRGESGVDGLETPKERSGKHVYRQVCASCHSAGLASIPQLADAAAWASRLSQGKEVLYRHSIDGFGAMPPKGLCEGCLEGEVRSAVDYMVKEIRKGR
jgi:glucose/arabinose dehydrogenase/cytochrome c5